MKKSFLILAFTLVATSISYAKLTLVKDSKNSMSVTLRIDNESDVKLLQNLLSLDDVKNEPNELTTLAQDTSNIRLLVCFEKYCDISVDADVISKNSERDIIYQPYEKKLTKLTDTQRLVLVPFIGKDSVSNSNGYRHDSLVTKKLIEMSNGTYSQQIKITYDFPKSKKFDAEEGSVSILKTSVKMKDLNLTCLSSFEFSMSDVPFASNECFIEAVAETQ